MKYCSSCGGDIEHRIPEGDDRHRHVCDDCETIHYQNPCIIAGCIPVYQSRVLLCRRAIEPAYGYWTLPAGFMENGETMLEGALRECVEEANAHLHSLELYSMIDIPHINQVYVFFRGELAKPEFSAGIESLEVELFEEHQIPWDNIAFPSVKKTLKHFFKDRESGVFPVRTDAIRRK
ncbi:MAG: NUDIX hydrolase [Cellvibrionales bacterium]|nr:MAG: NUDIX hydrolase [Cellvibrionales bacterium]